MVVPLVVTMNTPSEMTSSPVVTWLLLVTLLLALVVAVPAAPAAAAATSAQDVHLRVNVGGPRVEADPPWAADTKRRPSAQVDGEESRWSRTRHTVRTDSSPELAPAAVYARSRVDLGAAGDGGELRFSAAVPAGRYEVRLHLAETYGGSFATGARVFDVAAQGDVVLEDVDVFAEAGARRGMVRSVVVDVAEGDGGLDVELRHGAAGHPRLNGIEVVGLRTLAATDGSDEPSGRQPQGFEILHVVPNGAGAKDASSWDDAASLRQLPTLVAEAAPGTQVWLHAGLGSYHVTRPIGLRAGGTASQPVTIRGVDALGVAARATITGNRTAPYDPNGNRGSEVFRLLAGADHLAFQDIDFRNVGNGAFRIGAEIADLSIVGSHATNVRRFVENSASGDANSASVTGLEVRDVEVHGFSKSAIRLRYASNDVHVVDVVGDSQRQDFDRFAIGVHLTDHVHDVLLERVTMRNSHDTVTHAGGYWNGDGFATERNVRDVVFRDTVATGSTDAGYDLKSANTVLERPVAHDNKRNYRIWRRGVTIRDCVGSDPNMRGGTGSQAQVYLSDDAVSTITGCTFTDAHAGTTVYELSEGSRLRVVDSTQSHHADARLSREEPGSLLTFVTDGQVVQAD